MQTETHKRTYYILLGTLALFVLGRLLGGILFENNWSFTHWKYIPLSYEIVWAVLLVALLVPAVAKKLFDILSSGQVALVSFVALYVLLIVFQFDSFVYAGGNLVLAHIAQREVLIFRWYEFGFDAIAATVTSWFKSTDMRDVSGGYWVLKTISYIAVLLTMIATAKLVRELAENKTTGIILFVVALFGPAAILLFAPIGTETVIVAFLAWFSLLLIQAQKGYSKGRLAMLWVVALVGTLVHHSLIIMAPAALYVTFARKRRKLSLVGLIAGLILLIGLIAGRYYFASHNLEYASKILFMSGKNPYSDYGLFSARHLGDMVQLLFLIAPQLFAVLFLCTSQNTNRYLSAPLGLLLLGGFTVLFTTDPTNSIVLDLPRFAAYLFPAGVILAVHLSNIEGESIPRSHLLAAGMAILIPLAVIPAYTRIAIADPYATEYFDYRPTYYQSGSIAMRDAYFFRKDLDPANQWDWKLPVKSPGELLLRGARNMANDGQVAPAINEVYRLTIKYPYWVDPFAYLAQLQLGVGQFERAKEAIDHALALDPYNAEYLRTLYQYYRDTQQYQLALETIDRVLYLKSGDQEALIDRMIVLYRSQSLDDAFTLANELLTENPALSYPHFIRGLVFESRNDIKSALKDYETFLELDPEEAQLYNLQERVDAMKEALESVAP